MNQEYDPQKMAEIIKNHEITIDQFKTFMNEVVPVLVETSLQKSLPPFLDKEMHKSGYSEEAAGLIHLLAAKANDSKEETLLKALTLYGLALDAREKGNHLAIINRDDEIIHDVIGFEVESKDLDPIGVS